MPIAGQADAQQPLIELAGEQPSALEDEEQASSEPLAQGFDATSTGETNAALEPEPEPEPEPERVAKPVAAAEPEREPQAAMAPSLSLPAPERISSSTPLGGSARELVNPDGSLIQPPARGPLARLKQLMGS